MWSFPGGYWGTKRDGLVVFSQGAVDWLGEIWLKHILTVKLWDSIHPPKKWHFEGRRFGGGWSLLFWDPGFRFLEGCNIMQCFLYVTSLIYIYIYSFKEIQLSLSFGLCHAVLFFDFLSPNQQCLLCEFHNPKLKQQHQDLGEIFWHWLYFHVQYFPKRLIRRYILGSLPFVYAIFQYISPNGWVLVGVGSLAAWNSTTVASTKP